MKKIDKALKEGKTTKKKVVLLHLDEDTHKKLDKLARSKASRLKPYLEMKVKELVE